MPQISSIYELYSVTNTIYWDFNRWGDMITFANAGEHTYSISSKGYVDNCGRLLRIVQYPVMYKNSVKYKNQAFYRSSGTNTGMSGAWFPFDGMVPQKINDQCYFQYRKPVFSTYAFIMQILYYFLKKRPCLLLCNTNDTYYDKICTLMNKMLNNTCESSENLPIFDIVRRLSTPDAFIVSYLLSPDYYNSKSNATIFDFLTVFFRVNVSNYSYKVNIINRLLPSEVLPSEENEIALTIERFCEGARSLDLFYVKYDYIFIDYILDNYQDLGIIKYYYDFIFQKKKIKKDFTKKPIRFQRTVFSNKFMTQKEFLAFYDVLDKLEQIIISQINMISTKDVSIFHSFKEFVHAYINDEKSFVKKIIPFKQYASNVLEKLRPFLRQLPKRKRPTHTLDEEETMLRRLKKLKIKNTNQV
jgi:hypothetical protein